MHLTFTSEPRDNDGVTERDFALDEIPGILWTPEPSSTPAPLILLGHSMGSGIAAALAARTPDRFAGLVCFAGGPRASVEKLPPTWISVGALDPIANPDALEKGAKALAARGLVVQFERVPDLGHTLVVGERLGAAVEFLLGQHRP